MEVQSIGSVSTLTPSRPQVAEQQRTNREVQPQQDPGPRSNGPRASGVGQAQDTVQAPGNTQQASDRRGALAAAESGPAERAEEEPKERGGLVDELA